MVFAALKLQKVFLFILQDAEEAGYFYHDLTQQLDDKQVLFFPSSYKRAVKYGQKDPANEILRTEVLTSITHSPLTNSQGSMVNGQCLYIVSYPEAITEMVVAR